jgi:hypothetical protein
VHHPNCKPFTEFHINESMLSDLDDLWYGEPGRIVVVEAQIILGVVIMVVSDLAC